MAILTGNVPMPAARGDREVYTPQVVVNGVLHVLGSDKTAIENAIAQTRRNPAVLSLPVTMSVADGKVTVNVPVRARRIPQRLRFGSVPSQRKSSVQIGRGENHNQTLTYHNVVRRWIKLGDWNGQAQTFSVAGQRYSEGRLYAQGHRSARCRRSKRRCGQARPDARAPHPQPAAARLRTEISEIATIKIGPASAGPKALGIEPYAELNWPGRSNPGGLGG